MKRGRLQGIWLLCGVVKAGGLAVAYLWHVFCFFNNSKRNMMKKGGGKMIISVIKEIKPYENRVAATPTTVGELFRRGNEVFVERG